MQLTVVGIGYLGLTHAVCMANLGHGVLAIDVDRDKIIKAAKGEVPFFEPGLEPLLRKNIEAGRLRFTTSYEEIAEFGDVHFLCVGTPEAEDGTANLSYLHDAADALARHLQSACLVVGKSTVPVGTARAVMARIQTAAPAGNQVEVAWNPEFLREGFAVQDTLRPDRFVFGVTSMWAEELLIHVYDQPLAVGVPGLVMDLETAELVKVAANAFLATKISFINAMADVCEAASADVVRLAEALAYDGVHSRGTELGEEHVAHRGVVVLPGVDQDDLRPAFFERVHHRLDLHEVRPRSRYADDSHGVTSQRLDVRAGQDPSAVEYVTRVVR